MTPTVLSTTSPFLLAAAGAAALAGLVQLVLLWRLARSSRVAADALARVEKLTAALELLTDTTEEGFVNVTSELERLGARPPATGSTRRATTRRIAAAARKGRSLEDIALTESISESEVRLHLGLDHASAAEAAAAAAEAEASPGVLDDLERWMHTLQKPRRGRGARHAAVRV
ncbi:MAG: hypothetical protein R2745_06040 [Vicinamibacterales bacterium]